ncbi:helix-turn-helix domain-containing protein [Streptomyces prunicolor]|uniref:helix-turn-helix domain-containing protein n=1 Tax=Streptomyces prunicolor TaxID=67348 RepID=UPI0022529FF9|nr:helix-turn-helix domain-containing protein [Streptomyces prunicolor]MCX5239084.1 helix-turn-helix domain-containing protein [Streptomyces prunicolor]
MPLGHNFRAEGGYLPATYRYADDQALTVKEVAAWLRICKNTVFALIRTGDIESFTVGRSRRILALDVRAYMEQRKESG